MIKGRVIMQNSDYADQKIIAQQGDSQQSNPLGSKPAEAVPDEFRNILMEIIRQAESTVSYLSILMIAVDCCEDFVKADGLSAGEAYQNQIFQLLQSFLKRAGDRVVSWGADSFACILADTDAIGAAEMTRKIKIGVQDLELPNRLSTDQIAAVSIEGASFILTCETSLDKLISASLDALAQTREQTVSGA
jgi:PleD family two-component response regulator